jgi:hypothetical protein
LFFNSSYTSSELFVAPHWLSLAKRGRSYYTRNDITPTQLKNAFYREFNKKHVSVRSVTAVDEAFGRVFTHNCSTYKDNPEVLLFPWSILKLSVASVSQLFVNIFGYSC